MHRKIVSHLVVLALGMSMGLGAVAVAQNQVAGQARSNAEVVRQLELINAKLGARYKEHSLTGLTSDGFSDLHQDIVGSCNAVTRSISGSSGTCPSFIRP
jgi:hypothetical protein